MVRRHESGRRGMRAHRNFHKKVNNITEEEALKNLKEKVRRLANKLGWHDDMHKRPINKGLQNKKSHKSRVKHSAHGK